LDSISNGCKFSSWPSFYKLELAVVLVCAISLCTFLFLMHLLYDLHNKYKVYNSRQVVHTDVPLLSSSISCYLQKLGGRQAIT